MISTQGHKVRLQAQSDHDGIVEIATAVGGGRVLQVRLHEKPVADILHIENAVEIDQASHDVGLIVAEGFPATVIL